MSWSELGNGGADPNLVVDHDVALGVVAACAAFIGEIDLLKGELAAIETVVGMGTLQSGINLAAKFSRKAVGGEDSLEKSLNSHIQVVTEMRDYFQKCLESYSGVDTSNAVTLAGQDLPGS
jgi:hypothetical protein